jgi:hypothetical protein
MSALLLLLLYICSIRSSSVFGAWSGALSFNWSLDATATNAPTWTDSRGTVRRDHWHITGNDRLNVLLSDRGTVALFGTDRGERWLNELDESRLQLGGAFSYVRLGNASASELHCTAFQRDAPLEFGVGNVRSTRLIARALRVDRRVFAPYGNHSFVVDALNVTNVGGAPLSFQLTEFFDVNQLQLAIDWVVTGVAGTVAHDARRAINALFQESCAPLVANDSTVLCARMSMSGAATPAYVDGAPPRVFAAVVDGWSLAATHCDQRAFFGGGNATQPAALLAATVASSVLHASNAYDQSAMLAFTFQPRTLLPGQSLALSFVFGFAADDAGVRAAVDAVRASGADALWRATERAWQRAVVRVTLADAADADVARETAWRAANVLSWVTLRGDFGYRHAMTQGSAYLYLHGADGVPRDQSLFALAALFSRPDIVRSTLELLMQTQDATGAMTYAWGDVGERSDALGLHAWPSDLDLFLFWAVAEYVSFTGDTAWLASILAHLRVAAAHLIGSVGRGPHGLLRVQQGDWDDGVVVALADPIAIAFTVQRGESIPNSAMACVVLPRIAAAVKPLDASLAQQLVAYAAPLPALLRKWAFVNGTYARMWAVDGLDRPLLVANGSIDLQAVVWPLLADDNVLLTRAEKIALIDRVSVELSSPIGPIQSPSNAQVWPAISQLFVAAVASVPERAYLAAPLLRVHTFAQHQRAFPRSWVGVLSGPDGFDAVGGGTWESAVTPMVDWPVQNANPDAMFVFGAARRFGLFGTESGFAIDAARLNANDLPCRFESPLLDVAVRANGTIGVRFNAVNNGSVVVSARRWGSSTWKHVQLAFVRGDQKSLEF